MSYDDHTISISDLDDGLVLVEAIGEIDASSAPELQRDLLSVLADGRDRVLLDLSAVTYLDSSGVGAVVAAYAETRERGARLAVVGGDGHAAKRFRVMGLDALLEPVRSREEARERLTGG